MSLRDILHELAGRVNAPHLHDEIDTLPEPEPEPAADPAEPEPEAEPVKGKAGK